MPKRTLAGRQTYVTTFGQGPRPALAVHCSLAHSGAWGPLSRDVSGALTLTAFDLPGHGRSAPWDAQGEIQDVSTQIATALLPDPPCDLIGHSFGATVALRLAATHPERVRTLTLIEPVFFAVALRDDPSIAARYSQDMAAFVAAWDAGNRMQAARAFTAIWGGGAPWDAIPMQQQVLLADQIHLIPAANSALHNDTGQMLAPGILDRVLAPVLLVEGGETHWIIPRIMEGLAQRLPNAQRAVIAGAGHMAPITHADQVAREVLRLLSRS